MQVKAYHEYLIICFLFLFCFSSCSSLLYYPTRTLYYPPSSFGLQPEEAFIESSNGNKIYAWYFTTKKKPKANIVFYHGNAENMSSHYVTVIWLLDHGYNILTFDYQGYGRSEGEPSPEGSIADGEAALKWISEKSKLPIILLGQSLGGAVALKNAIDKKFPIQFVVVDSTFASYKKVARYALKKHWFTWPLQWLGSLLISDVVAPWKEIDKISPTPLLVIHGDQDQIVDFELGNEVFSQAREPKEFWHIPGGKHTDVFVRKDNTFRKEFVNKLERAL